MKKLDNTYRRLLATLAALLTVLSVSAQFDTQLSQYWAMPAYYNPAATGTTDYLHIGGGTRLQWIGIPKAPKAFLAGADMPVKLFGKRIGVGVMVQQESLGLFSNLNAGAQAFSTRDSKALRCISPTVTTTMRKTTTQSPPTTFTARHST